MGLVARPIPVGASGFDTISVVTRELAAAARADGRRFVLRYGLGVSRDELDVATGEGLIVGFLTYGRQADYSEATGHEDARRLLDHLHGTLSVPTGCTMGLDLETPKGASHAELYAYEGAYADDVVAADDSSGLYVGAGLLMTSRELYAFKSTRYYKSGSRIVDGNGQSAEPECGWALYQVYPLDQTFAGTRVDYDFAQGDFRGRQWWGVAAG